MREAHAEGAHHEALPPDAVHEHAALAAAAAASSATRTGARRVPGEDGRDLGADGGCVAAAAHRGLLLSYPKADDEPPFEWECGTAYGQQDRLIMDSGVLGNLRPQIGFFFYFYIFY